MYVNRGMWSCRGKPCISKCHKHFTSFTNDKVFCFVFTKISHPRVWEIFYSILWYVMSCCYGIAVVTLLGTSSLNHFVINFRVFIRIYLFIYLFCFFFLDFKRRKQKIIKYVRD